MIPTTKDAYNLIHEGALALAEIEAAGLRIDTVHLDNSIKKVSRQIVELERKLRNDEVYDVWRKEYGQKANLGSRPQLAKIIFEKLGFKHRGEKTEGGESGNQRLRANEIAFEHVDLPFIKRLFRMEKLKKLKGTYLDGLKKEVVDGYLHPFFNLHTVETYRSSGSHPNFQNIPIRNVLIGEIIRKCFIPREGNALIEIDYGALEWVIASAVWKDPKMVEYSSDPTKDIHRDKAAEIFSCNIDQVEKKGMRYIAKNQFVFPKLYGSYYKKMARNIWESIDKYNLKLKDSNIPVGQWLKEKGITKLGKCDPKLEAKPGTYEYYIKCVEEKFDSDFHVLCDAKWNMTNEYKKQGWFRTVTGFVIKGVYSDNFLYNAPIQSAAFHCLLWSLIRLVKEIKKKKFKSKVVGQIHDCVLCDCPMNELQDVLAMAKRIMTEDIRKYWDWIIAPLKAEVDVVMPGETWFDKKVWVENNGIWGPKK